ncbi:MAG: hypothetical protein KGD60_10530, partial [Candidatus Thorarchaeota archaeon]|nr:hypothetical protein [Candidatus Thorarchaeota archaeon]
SNNHFSFLCFFAVSLIHRFKLLRFEDEHMPECEACGASVKAGVRECPFCGHSFVKHTAIAKPGTKDTSKFTVEREAGVVHFGDGEIGTRPPIGKDNVSTSYRYGGGSKGSLVCPNCKLENPETRSDCEACGSPLKRPIDRLRR